MELVDAIERSTHLIAVLLGPELTELGVGQAEANVLAHLARRPAMTVRDLHHRFGHKRSTLTNLIDRLERRGLVARTTILHVSRSIVVLLTPAGEAPARLLRAAREESGSALSRK